MLDIIQSWRSKNNLRKILLSFLDEMERNLETYYVIDQRQFIVNGFTMTAWDKAKDLDLIKSKPVILQYGAALTDFNNAFAEHKAYEQWYTSDIQNKTQENGKKLHALKNALDQRVKTLEPIIIPAGQELEKELLKLGFITT